MDSIFDCYVHTLETPTIVGSTCAGQFLAGSDATCCALAKQSGIVVLKSESDGATPTINLSSYDRVDHVHTLSVQGVCTTSDDCAPGHILGSNLTVQSHEHLCRLGYRPTSHRNS